MPGSRRGSAPAWSWPTPRLCAPPPRSGSRWEPSTWRRRGQCSAAPSPRVCTDIARDEGAESTDEQRRIVAAPKIDVAPGDRRDGGGVAVARWTDDVARGRADQQGGAGLASEAGHGGAGAGGHVAPEPDVRGDAATVGAGCRGAAVRVRLRLHGAGPSRGDREEGRDPGHPRLSRGQRGLLLGLV